MEDTSEICCLCNLKLDGYVGVSEVCHTKTHFAHDACVEASYATYCSGSGFAACPCGFNHLVMSLVPRYVPSLHHAPWLRVFGYATSPYHIIGDATDPRESALMHSPTLQDVESLRAAVNPAEFRLSAWSKRFMTLVFCLSVIGIIVMAFIGAIDWRMEIAFWTILAAMFLFATILAPESVSYFWMPGNTTRAYARAYNKRMLYAHLGVFAAFGLSYTIMMSLSINNYSHIWNGVTTFSVGFIVAYLVYKRYSNVLFQLNSSRFVWYSSTPTVRPEAKRVRPEAKRAHRLSDSSDEDDDKRTLVVTRGHSFTIEENP